jgi:hypothetical protein
MANAHILLCFAVDLFPVPFSTLRSSTRLASWPSDCLCSGRSRHCTTLQQSADLYHDQVELEPCSNLVQLAGSGHSPDARRRRQDRVVLAVHYRSAFCYLRKTQARNPDHDHVLRASSLVSSPSSPTAGFPSARSRPRPRSSERVGSRSARRSSW